MNPFAHFEDQFGHLQLSDNDAALHVFLAGWNSAMMEMMQRVNKMPFGDDTRASFAVYFQSQMINVDAIEKPAQQQDADHDFKNFHRSLCERFNYVHDEKDWKRDLVSLEEWIAKKVQPEQEPVAVVSGYYGGKCVILPIDPARIYNSNTPLYTAPSPCPTCEALARTVMLDQTSHDTHRKPLPCETLIELWCDASLANSGSGWFVVSGAFARAIEAAHGIREKNT